MKRSARSVRTGPGSRGGRWHDPEYRKAYYRAWRAAHGAYRERERVRRREAKRALALARDRAEVEALIYLIEWIEFCATLGVEPGGSSSFDPADNRADRGADRRARCA